LLSAVTIFEGLQNLFLDFFLLLDALIMEQQLHSLSKLFTERLYRIPDYQRGYAWTEKHIKDFWVDLLQLEKDKNHYLGVLTLEQVSREIVKSWKDDYWIVESKSYSPYYIVDGQQRLTTAIILIQAIIESVSSVNKETELNYNSLAEIRKKFIFDSKDKGISRSYMFGYETDNPSYEFLKTKIFLESSGSSETPQETIYTHNLEFAKKFFKERLEYLTLDEKENIYRKLTQNLLFNIYTISTDIDVFVAFETMNNRGKLLSYLELLKNRLIYLSTKFEVEDYERETLRNSINTAWKSMYHHLGKNKNQPLDDDQFLQNHFMIYFGKKSSGIDNDEFLIDVESSDNIFLKRSKRDYSTYLLERKFTVKSIMSIKTNEKLSANSQEEDKEILSLNDVYAYVSSLQSCVELWYKILNPNDSDFSIDERIWIDKLIRLSRRSDFFPSAPLIMVFFQKEKKKSERIKLLKALEGIYFLLILSKSRYPLFFLSDTFTPFRMIQLAVRLSNGDITKEKVVKDLEENRHKMANDENFLADITKDFKDGFYKWRGIKYFLYEYDLHLHTKSGTERQKINWIEFSNSDYETIEHIYPQTPKKLCWKEKFANYSTQQRKILRNSLGNLLPLSRQKNSSFGNSCFTEKISNDKNYMGYMYGSYAENEITKYKDWTAKEILDRGIKLLEFMESRWNISLGDRNDKIHFLNLQFVEDIEKQIGHD
jgi:uncharacterized protein with ParB-like and HNH nuclease domain